MSAYLRRFVHALSRNHAETDIHEADPGLRGRTYAIPFEQVWQAACSLANGGLRRWHILQADDYEGLIQAEARTLVLRFVDDVLIRVYLDKNAQTRVDMQSRSRKGSVDFGTNARRIRRFFRALDRRLAQQARVTARH